MKNFIIVVLIFLLIVSVIFGFLFDYPMSPNKKSESKKLTALNSAIAERDATIAQLQAIVSVYTATPQARQDYQVMEIIVNGVNGPVCYQLEASNRKDKSASTAGPLGFSWQSTRIDALESAKLRRGQKTEVKKD